MKKKQNKTREDTYYIITLYTLYAILYMYVCMSTCGKCMSACMFYI